MGTEANLRIVDYTPPTATALAFDFSRQYTEKDLGETNSAIKRNVACTTCRSARAKCDIDVTYPSPCSRCAKKGCSCEQPPRKDREKGNSSVSAHQVFGREFSYGLNSPPPYSAYPNIQTSMTYGTPEPTYTQSQIFNNWNYSGNWNSHLPSDSFLQTTQHGLANSNVPRAYY